MNKLLSLLKTNAKRKGEFKLAGKPKGPKQQERPKLPQSPAQPYGEPLSGSKKVKTANHSRQKNNPHHGL